MNGAATNVIVLSGDRAPKDPLRRHTGAASKSLVKLCGISLIERITRTIDQCSATGERWLVGPVDLLQSADAQLYETLLKLGWQFVAPAATPATSASQAITTAGTQAPILLTTVDHGLLTADLVDTFVSRALQTGADVAVGFVRYDDVMAAYPQSRRTGWAFRDGRFCGCNLYLLANARGAGVVKFWQRVEGARKNPLRIAAALGAMTSARYLAGTLSLQQGLNALGAQTGARIAPVLLHEAHAAVDIDTVDDLLLAESVLLARS